MNANPSKPVVESRDQSINPTEQAHALAKKALQKEFGSSHDATAYGDLNSSDYIFIF